MGNYKKPLCKKYVCDNVYSKYFSSWLSGIDNPELETCQEHYSCSITK